MNNYIQLTEAQKQTVLTQCKNLMGLPEQAVEKDYWVTVMLQLIFDSELSEHIIFKGGTSLSKNGNLIERFSEDIDLAAFNPFNITCDPHFQNKNKLPDFRDVFTRELTNTFNRLATFNEASNREALTSMVTGYTFNLVESYYNNAGYVPKNTFDEILEQVYDAIQQTGFRALRWTLDDFKYNCYYGYLNE